MQKGVHYIILENDFQLALFIILSLLTKYSLHVNKYIYSRNRVRGYPPGRILCLGTTGAGKSGFTNTLAASIRGKFIQKMKSGRGTTGSKTRTLQT